MRSWVRPILAGLLLAGGSVAVGVWTFFGFYLLLCEDVSDCTEHPALGIALLVLAAIAVPVFPLAAARVAGQRRWVLGGLLALLTILATGVIIAATPLVSWTIPIAVTAGMVVTAVLGRRDSATRTPR